jgi:cardiolipin synthase
MSTFDILAAFTVESHGWAILKNPVSSAGRFLNTGVQTLAGILQSRFPRFKESPPPISNLTPMDLKSWEKYLDRMTGRVSEPGSFDLFIDGEQFFPVFEKRLREAQASISLRLCIFDRDDVAVGTADLLKARAEEVPVRIIYDRLSSQVTGSAMPETSVAGDFVAPLTIGSYLQRQSKVRVRPFLNTAFSAEHSKVLIIDGKTAFLGGMNIGREYRYEWHDLMFEIQGPIVASFQSDFERSWAHAGALGDLAYANAALAPPKTKAHPTPKPTAPLRRLYTKTGICEIRKAVLKSLNGAHRQVFLENPYLYDSVVVGALAKARHRGVDVRVILPSENDLQGGRSSNLVVANYLLRNGVRVFVYPGMTHVKALWVDGWVCLGSANFNNLSLRRNHEANIATSDPGISELVLKDLFAVDFAKCHELTSELESSWTDHLVQTLFEQF